MSEQIIRGLTLWRPWDVAMRDLGKPIENRKWAPPPLIQGQLVALHSGKTWDDDGAMHIALQAHGSLEDEDCPSGFITCVARVTGCMHDARGGGILTEFYLPLDRDPQASPSDEDVERWFFGPYGWLMPERVPIAPVPCRGAQGLWKMPPEIETEVLRRYKEAGGR